MNTLRTPMRVLFSTVLAIALLAVSCSSPITSLTGKAEASSLQRGLVLPVQRTFVHPGAANKKDDLDFVKAKIAAGEQPWAAKFNEVKAKAVAYTKTTSPQDGAENAQKDDGLLAYANALAWYYTGNATYAQNGIAVLNVWGRTFNGYAVPAPGQGNQSQLNAAWIGTLLGPAAEILRGYAGWAPADIAMVQNMFKTKFYPALNQASSWNGNVDLTQADAMLNIAVFNDDAAEFNLGIDRLEKRTPNYFYLVADGPRNDAAVWFNPLKWVDGLTQETARDYGHHTQFALAAALQAAEVARNQGVDVYGEFQTRYVAAMELLALQINTGNMQGVVAAATTTDLYDTFEIGYNHYHNRVGLALANTQTLLTRVRASGASDWNIFYETLTHDKDGAGTVVTTTTVPITTTTVPVTTTTVPVTTTTVPVTTTTLPAAGVALPGKVTASAYTAITGTLKTEVCTDLGGGLDVGYTSVGGYLRYAVNVAVPGAFQATYRVASAQGGSFDVLIDGAKVDTIAVPNTGGWQSWVTLNGNGAYTLSAGAHTLQITVATTAYNLNWITFTAGTPVTTTTVPVTTTTVPVTTTTVPVTTTTVPVTTTTTIPSAGLLKVGYVKNDWGTGFSATITLTNTGTAAVSGWKLAFSYTGNQVVTNPWSATVVQTGKNVVMTPLSYNTTVAPGTSITIGFNANYSGTNVDPVNFTVTK